MIAFPCAVGMGILASPILQLLFRDSSETAAHMLQVGAVTILFFSLSTLSNGLLQGIGRMKEPIKNAIIALVLHLGLLAALMFLFDLNIFASRYRKCSIRSYHVYFKCRINPPLQWISSGNSKNIFCPCNRRCRYGCCCMARLSWHSVRAAC